MTDLSMNSCPTDVICPILAFLNFSDKLAFYATANKLLQSKIEYSLCFITLLPYTYDSLMKDGHWMLKMLRNSNIRTVLIPPLCAPFPWFDWINPLTLEEIEGQNLNTHFRKRDWKTGKTLDFSNPCWHLTFPFFPFPNLKSVKIGSFFTRTLYDVKASKPTKSANVATCFAPHFFTSNLTSQILISLPQSVTTLHINDSDARWPELYKKDQSLLPPNLTSLKLTAFGASYDERDLYPPKPRPTDNFWPAKAEHHQYWVKDLLESLPPTLTEFGSLIVPFRIIRPNLDSLNWDSIPSLSHLQLDSWLLALEPLRSFPKNLEKLTLVYRDNGTANDQLPIHIENLPKSLSCLRLECSNDSNKARFLTVPLKTLCTYLLHLELCVLALPDHTDLSLPPMLQSLDISVPILHPSAIKTCLPTTLKRLHLRISDWQQGRALSCDESFCSKWSEIKLPSSLEELYGWPLWKVEQIQALPKRIDKLHLIVLPLLPAGKHPYKLHFNFVVYLPVPPTAVPASAIQLELLKHLPTCQVSMSSVGMLQYP